PPVPRGGPDGRGGPGRGDPARVRAEPRHGETLDPRLVGIRQVVVVVRRSPRGSILTTRLSVVGSGDRVHAAGLSNVGNDVELAMSTSEAAAHDLDTCFRDLFPRVARTAALVSRDPGLGPDIAQEAFARLYERWDRIESAEHARNFAFRVAVNLARSHLRRRLALPFGLR